MDTLTLIVLILVLIAIFVSVLCVKQKYKGQKACFFVDLFTTSAAGASLVISTSILHQTIVINHEVEEIYEYSSAELDPSAYAFQANVRLIGVNLGDGQGFELRLLPLNVESESQQ